MSSAILGIIKTLYGSRVGREREIDVASLSEYSVCIEI